MQDSNHPDSHKGTDNYRAPDSHKGIDNWDQPNDAHKPDSHKTSQNTTFVSEDISKTGTIVSWIFAVFCGMVGLSAIVSGDAAPGILLITLALFLLPVLRNWWNTKIPLLQPRNHRIWAIIALSVLFVIAVSVKDKTKGITNTTVASSTTTQPAETQIITASELHGAYSANEVAADENFKGETFVVEGTIGEISKDFVGNASVNLVVGMFEFVRCDFGRNTDALGSLSKGQRVRIKGTCEGFLIRSVMMTDCEFAN